MNTKKLKPCPFCGKHHAEHRTDFEGFHYIVCTTDGCYVRTDGCLNKNAAIESWNRRANNENKTKMEDLPKFKPKKIYVIGAIKGIHTIQKVAKIFEKAGHEVRYVQRKSILFADSIIEGFENIDWSDIVVVVPKKDEKLGTRTLYESSYANHIGRDVYIYDRQTEWFRPMRVFMEDPSMVFEEFLDDDKYLMDKLNELLTGK